jgi:hypothetical protein
MFENVLEIPDLLLLKGMLTQKINNVELCFSYNAKLTNGAKCASSV